MFRCHSKSFFLFLAQIKIYLFYLQLFSNINGVLKMINLANMDQFYFAQFTGVWRYKQSEKVAKWSEAGYLDFFILFAFLITSLFSLKISSIFLKQTLHHTSKEAVGTFRALPWYEQSCLLLKSRSSLRLSRI